MGYDSGYAKYVSDLCQFNMQPLTASDKKLEEIREMMGETFYNDLMLLHKADKSAK